MCVCVYVCVFLCALALKSLLCPRVLCRKDLHKRVIQHNIRVIGTYYQNIRMPRLAQLLELTEEEAEKHVCDMVVAGSLWCRIDRLKGVATFQVHTHLHIHHMCVCANPKP